MPRLSFSIFIPAILFLCLVIGSRPVKAYSVLTHEALIDASWQKYIRPLLKAKYPDATDGQLKEAHAYVYGGCLLPDMGYYPFGSVYFTDLAHYVRTGDFVQNLINEAENLDEYAFAIGALCHYYGDKYGHSVAVNLTVPDVYPKIGKKFGPVVTYEDDHNSHSRVELAFDVLEIARGNYASETYHDFIGFQVSKPVLERAFIKTYGQDINDVFSNIDLAISTFRWAVKSLFPVVTHSAWVQKRDEIKEINPGASARRFHYRMRRKAYFKEFGSARQKPGFKDFIVGFLIKVLPKIGPLKALKFKEVGPTGEKRFIASFDSCETNYRAALTSLQNGNLVLPNIDYDTGNATVPGEYNLADQSYVDLLDNLADENFIDLTAPLQQNLLAFYNRADTTQLAERYPDKWKKTDADLRKLRVFTAVPTDSLRTKKGQNYKFHTSITADDEKK